MTASRPHRPWEDRMRKVSYLTTAEFAVLNNACIPVREAFGYPPYLVGSSTEHADYRDVDLRVILPDEEFDRLFQGRPLLWSIVCLAIGRHLATITGLPVDFQIQRRTQANEKYQGPRNPMGSKGRPFAGGGDATSFAGPEPTPDEQLEANMAAIRDAERRAHNEAGRTIGSGAPSDSSEDRP